MRCVDVLREIKRRTEAKMVKVELTGAGVEVTVWFDVEVFPFSVEDPEWDTPETLVSEIVDAVEKRAK